MSSSSTTQFGQNQWLVDEMYQRFKQDPSSVDASWHEFLTGYDPDAVTEDQTAADSNGASGNGAASNGSSTKSAPPAAPAPPAKPAASAAPKSAAKTEAAPSPVGNKTTIRIRFTVLGKNMTYSHHSGATTSSGALRTP